MSPRTRAAFEEALAPHLGALYRVALRLCRHTHQAEDLVQETAVKALRHWSRLPEDATVRPWLFTILTHTYIDGARKQRRAPALVPFDEERDDVDDTVPGLAVRRTPEADVLNRELRRVLVRAIDALPEPFRVVLVLAEMEGLSYEEIATALGIPIGTVMSRLFRARRAVRARVGPYLSTDAGRVAPRRAGAPPRRLSVVPGPGPGRGTEE